MKYSSIENLSKSKNLKNPKNPEIEPSNPSILDFEKSQDWGWFSLKVQTGYFQIFLNEIFWNVRKKWFSEVFWCFRWFSGHFISVSGHFSNTRQTWACSNSFRPFRIKYKSVEPTGKTHFNYWTLVNRSEFRRPFEHRNRTDFEVFGLILFWFDSSLRQGWVWIWRLISLLWAILFWSTFLCWAQRVVKFTLIH